MSEAPGPISTVARSREQLRAVCELLAEHPKGLHVREVVAKVKKRVPPTEAELTLTSSGSERYDTNIRWWSVDLVKAGWISKEKGIWRLTHQGRQALEDYPDPHEFGGRANALYREWKERNDAAKESREYWKVTDQVLGRIPPGHWATFTDVAELGKSDAKHLGIHLWTDRPAGWHRVLRIDGTASADFHGAEDRSSEQHRLLSDEGLTLDGPAGPRAAPGCRRAAQPSPPRPDGEPGWCVARR